MFVKDLVGILITLKDQPMQGVFILRLTRNEKAAIDSVIQYINSNYSNKISADNLSLDFQISPKKLQAGVKNVTGKSVHSYLLAVRISRAKHWLVETDEPVKNIPDKVGFADVTHFIKTFKKYTGKTPSEFRLSHDV